MNPTTRLHVSRWLGGFLCGLVGIIALAQWGFWAEMVGAVAGFILGTALPRLSWRSSVSNAPHRARELWARTQASRSTTAFFSANVALMVFLAIVAASGAFLLTAVLAQTMGFSNAFAVTFLVCFLSAYGLFYFTVLCITFPGVSIKQSLTWEKLDINDPPIVLQAVRWRRYQKFGLMAYMLDQYNRIVWATMGAPIVMAKLTLQLIYRVLYMWRTLPMFTKIAYYKAIGRARRWTASFAVSAVAAVATTIVSGYALRPHFGTIAVGLCALSVGVLSGVASYSSPLFIRWILGDDEQGERDAIAKCHAIIIANWQRSQATLAKLRSSALNRAWERWFPNMRHWHMSL